MQKQPHPHESLLNSDHPAYKVMDRVLETTNDFTLRTAYEIMHEILQIPKVTMNEVEVQDVFLIVCNVAKVRQTTGKRRLGRPSHALNILYKHAEVQARAVDARYDIKSAR